MEENYKINLNINNVEDMTEADYNNFCIIVETGKKYEKTIKKLAINTISSALVIGGSLILCAFLPHLFIPFAFVDAIIVSYFADFCDSEVSKNYNNMKNFKHIKKEYKKLKKSGKLNEIIKLCEDYKKLHENRKKQIEEKKSSELTDIKDKQPVKPKQSKKKNNDLVNEIKNEKVLKL